MPSCLRCRSKRRQERLVLPSAPRAPISTASRAPISRVLRDRLGPPARTPHTGANQRQLVASAGPSAAPPRPKGTSGAEVRLRTCRIVGGSVVPPCSHAMTWWASHQLGGAPHPGNTHPPSRMVSARRSSVVTSRRVRLSSRMAPRVSSSRNRHMGSCDNAVMGRSSTGSPLVVVIVVSSRTRVTSGTGGRESERSPARPRRHSSARAAARSSDRDGMSRSGQAFRSRTAWWNSSSARCSIAVWIGRPVSPPNQPSRWCIPSKVGDTRSESLRSVPGWWPPSRSNRHAMGRTSASHRSSRIPSARPISSDCNPTTSSRILGFAASAMTWA